MAWFVDKVLPAIVISALFSIGGFVYLVSDTGFQRLINSRIDPFFPPGTYILSSKPENCPQNWSPVGNASVLVGAVAVDGGFTEKDSLGRSPINEATGYKGVQFQLCRKE